MKKNEETFQTAASLVLAAGKGSRMTGYEGNKTLLPLIPSGPDPTVGSRPLLVEVLENLPPGPKGVVVHHRAEDVRRETAASGCTYIHQPVTDGTGGAVLAARAFLENVSQEAVILTMGDVPLIRRRTYHLLLQGLGEAHMTVLAFHPDDPAQYGKLDIDQHRVRRIVEWKYWSRMPGRMEGSPCNAGVYAVRRESLLLGLDELARKPHEVYKERDSRRVLIREYFLTDLVEILGDRNLIITFRMAEPWEVLGVDTPEALRRAQDIYRLRQSEN